VTDSGLGNKVVIVTGAAAGIGRVTALRFAEEGARVSAWDVDEEHGATLVGEITNGGGHAAFVRVNVADRAEVERAVASVVAQWGRIDVLVNNAGIVRDAQMIKWKDGEIVSIMTDEMFDAVVDVNLKGVFCCARAVVPHMIRQGAGVILNASSVVGLYGNFGQTNYAATKAAVGRYNIRVNAVAPGFIATDILRSMPRKVLDSMVSHTPLGRMGEPRDIADAYVWLASDQASFVNGTTISVDGGLVVGT
jgi:3-oxoacyl-[acyl-carrier protein] reductase